MFTRAPKPRAGFTGSSGTAVITQDAALVWTDGALGITPLLLRLHFI